MRLNDVHIFLRRQDHTLVKGEGVRLQSLIPFRHHIVALVHARRSSFVQFRQRLSHPRLPALAASCAGSGRRSSRGLSIHPPRSITSPDLRVSRAPTVRPVNASVLVHASRVFYDHGEFMRLRLQYVGGVRHSGDLLAHGKREALRLVTAQPTIVYREFEAHPRGRDTAAIRSRVLGQRLRVCVTNRLHKCLDSSLTIPTAGRCLPSARVHGTDVESFSLCGSCCSASNQAIIVAMRFRLGI
mmetsp:Transcript_52670/g.136413  ORF Transcript_52670/g.136413 Transcript_52670/m.136413 type:complete len:242 (+) Transcript_52670:497-1222(+)